MLSNWIRSRVPVARATLSSVRVDGGVRPVYRPRTERSGSCDVV